MDTFVVWVCELCGNRNLIRHHRADYECQTCGLEPSLLQVESLTENEAKTLLVS